jgi:hypothetical protein
MMPWVLVVAPARLSRLCKAATVAVPRLVAMSDTVKPGPDGYHSLNQFIVCRDAAKAIEFYQEVFGAQVLSRHNGDGGVVVHADLRIGDSILQLCDPLPGYGLAEPEPADAVSSSSVLYCEDADAVFARLSSLKSDTPEDGDEDQRG